MHPQYSHHDEIDLRELFIALWRGKLIIIATTIIFAIAAVFYALNSQEWWSSKAKIAQAQPQDISSYQQQVKQFQPVFDIYQQDGTVLVSDELNDLIDTVVLFQRFIDAFNSSDNKRAFLDSSEDFQTFKSKLDADADADADAESKQDATRHLYAEWLKKIAAAAEKGAKPVPYNLTLQATTKQSSYTLLNGYLETIKHKAHKDALNNLEAMVAAKRNELVQQKRILTSQAQNRLQVEIERAQYALEIAKAAGLDLPIQTNNSQEIFAIDFGAKALAAKVTALKSVKNLSVIEPQLQQIDAKLDMLENLKVDRNIKFQTFRFLENVEEPITRDKPKRALIAVLGTMLGGMLGVAIVLIRFAFRREEPVAE
ncbi:Wzz/FepE/Etk N-terminal domain-containing protein [Vibrio scophthalmi]|uniref:LPS O-antigen chain length determinant protein WzzB n=1 Tax=Vibrio scophthalmi TaxID=45658 RepID=UPI003AAC6634